ncbi:MAG: hypothetical protein Q9220_001755 [cf. Caloplaca sp. 1 TL-2023]
MFGTTETQRAVSYFQIPSQNEDESFLDQMTEVIPAGRGMYDVQLLVVNREDRTKQCEIGEVGEIYVRAGGLSEGYLGDELADLTRTKFVENWFVEPRKWIEEDNKRVAQQKARQPWRKYYKGPRDRLYRSGDLGRYMPSGDVECTGRADNQIKIRGFRIELGEIDKWVSEHPLCQENVTLLRRDKDEEPTLVTYIVPNMKTWEEWIKERDIREDQDEDDSISGLLKRYKALRHDLRDFLKSKLPSYAIPSVVVALKRMPLNPNGKIDRPALPFPTDAELNAAATSNLDDRENDGLSDTEKMVASIWAQIIPHLKAEALKLQQSIRPNDSFDALGGHSILAQRVIVAVKKQWQSIDVNVTTVIQNDILRNFAAEIDRSLDPTGLLLGKGDNIAQEEDYAIDAHNFKKDIRKSYPSANLDPAGPLTVFLTGATGFLGAYVLRDLLSRGNITVIVHVRAKTEDAGLDRLRETCQAYGIWSDKWSSRLRCVIGDLQAENLGLNAEAWDKVVNEADMVIHNGAKVHWLQSYIDITTPDKGTDSKLKPANVLSTVTAMNLCAVGKPKAFAFVSSTSVLDTNHYVQMSDVGTPVPESDDLSGSSKGLGTGYGQSKWVSEYLVREAGRRGLRGAIVRPGYVTGDLRSGVTNTDDFLIRYLKGCIQLHSAPVIDNGINMVPVDHVARCVVACALYPPKDPEEGVNVAQITAPSPRMTFTDFASVLTRYGYRVESVGYEQWREDLVEYVARQGGDQHALLPLLNFVTAPLPAADLPADTRAPLLEDQNTVAALQRAADRHPTHVGGSYPVVNEDVVGLYIAFLVQVGFLPAPPKGKGEMELPRVELGQGVGVRGRGGTG